jgi:hypothetical protein
MSGEREDRPTAVGELKRQRDNLRRRAASERAEALRLREQAAICEQEALTCERVANESDVLLTKAGEQ